VIWNSLNVASDTIYNLIATGGVNASNECISALGNNWLRLNVWCGMAISWRL